MNGPRHPEGEAPRGEAMRHTDEQLQRALDLAYAYVNRRERTVADVERQLEGRGIVPASIQAVTRTLSEQGFLDDARFARLYVEDKRELEWWGTERIRRGLLSRGIGRELAETATKPAPETSGPGETDDLEAETELDRALTLLRRRFPAPLAERRERERALGVLLRKGYESELALDALRAHARGD